MKKTSIKIAIIIPSVAVLIVGIIAMITVVGVLSSKTTYEITEQLLDARVSEHSNEFLAFSQDVYSTLNATAPIIANYIDPDFAADVSDPRGEVIKILSDVVESSDRIYGMWTCWETNAFDGQDSAYANTSFYDNTGRFIPYVYKAGSGLEVEGLVDYDDPVNGEYYQGALTTGRPYVTDPFIYTVDGVETTFYTFAIPILQNGKVAGVVGADVDLRDVVSVMNEARILEDGYLLTLSPGGFIATHTNPDYLLASYKSIWLNDFSPQIESILAHGGSFNNTGYSDVLGADAFLYASGVMIGDTGRYWLVCGIVPATTVDTVSMSLVWIIVAIGLALIVIVGLTIFFIVRNRLKELPVLTATAEAIARGDIGLASPDAEGEATKNEISLLAHAFAKMTASIRQQADVLNQIAQGDYSISIPVRSDKDIMNQAINQMLDSTNDTLHQISTASVQVSTGSQQIADGAQSLALGSTEQASAIEQLSASIGEISVKTKENADIAKQAAALSGTIRDNVEKGNAQMDNMMQAVKEINDASGQINKVIKVIDDIAFQTNILALNAAVEAARAGQHGKGFAVVAEEVRSLSAKSAAAAKDTGVLIENSIAKANLGLDIATETSASLKEIVEGINRSTEIVVQIAQSSDEQAGAIAQINTGIEQVAQVIQQNSATAEESAAASQEMSGQSNMLEQLIEQFKLKDAQPGPKTLPMQNDTYASIYVNSKDGFGKY